MEISHGTFKPEHLFAAIFNYVEGNGKLGEMDFSPELCFLLDLHNERLLDQAFELEVLNQELVSELLYEELWREMENIAPKGTYFGSHIGDGSLIGFWPEEE